jgi:hypothetical protein
MGEGSQSRPPRGMRDSGRCDWIAKTSGAPASCARLTMSSLTASSYRGMGQAVQVRRYDGRRCVWTRPSTPLFLTQASIDHGLLTFARHSSPPSWRCFLPSFSSCLCARVVACLPVFGWLRSVRCGRAVPTVVTPSLDGMRMRMRLCALFPGGTTHVARHGQGLLAAGEQALGSERIGVKGHGQVAGLFGKINNTFAKRQRKSLRLDSRSGRSEVTTVKC